MTAALRCDQHADLPDAGPGTIVLAPGHPTDGGAIGLCHCQEVRTSAEEAILLPPAPEPVRRPEAEPRERSREGGIDGEPGEQIKIRLPKRWSRTAISLMP
jgi:hypothetical protein